MCSAIMIVVTFVVLDVRRVAGGSPGGDAGQPRKQPLGRAPVDLILGIPRQLGLAEAVEAAAGLGRRERPVTAVEHVSRLGHGQQRGQAVWATGQRGVEVEPTQIREQLLGPTVSRGRRRLVRRERGEAPYRGGQSQRARG